MVTPLSARGRRPAAAFGKLGELGRPADPLQIALDQLGLGPAPDLARARRCGAARISRPRAAARAVLGRLLERPHPLEIVEAAHFRPEEVDDHVLGIDQHPVGDRQPFDADVAAEILLDPLGQLLGHRRDLAGRSPGGDHHMVGDVGFAGERDGDDSWAWSSSSDRSTSSCRASTLSVAPALRGAGDDAGNVPPYSIGRRVTPSRSAPGLNELRALLVPVRIGSAKAGGGGRIGRQSQEHECRQSPLRPLPRFGRGPDEAAQPAHGACRLGSAIISGPGDDGNRHQLRQFCASPSSGGTGRDCPRPSAR